MNLRELVNVIGFEVDESAMKHTEAKAHSLFNNIKEIAEVSLKAIASMEIFKIGKEMVSEYEGLNIALAVANQRVISTGQAAGKTIEDIKNFAEELADGKTFLDATDIIKAENEMLKFQDISGDVFDDAIKASIELASSMDGDVAGAAERLGRSLNNPGQSLRMLAMQGISFTKAEKERIETMAESGRRAEAQTLLLDALRRSLGGTSAAIYDSEVGAKKYNKSVKELSESFGEILFPYFKKFYEILTDVVDWFRMLPKETNETIAALTGVATALMVITALKPALRLLISTVVMPLIVSFGWWLIPIAAVAAALFLLTEDFLHFAKGGKSFIGQFLEPWSLLKGRIMAYIQPIIDYGKVVFSGVINIVKGVVQIISSLFTGNSEKAKQGLNNILLGLQKLFEGLLVGLMYALIAFSNFVVYKLIPNLIKVVATLAWNLLSSISEMIMKMVGDSVQWVVEKLNKIPGVKRVIDFATNIGKGYQSATKQQAPNMFPDFERTSKPDFTPGHEPGWMSLFKGNSTSNRSNAVTNHNQINVTVPPGTNKEQADHISKVIDEKLNFQTRQTVNNFRE